MVTHCFAVLLFRFKKTNFKCYDSYRLYYSMCGWMILNLWQFFSDLHWKFQYDCSKNNNWLLMTTVERFIWAISIFFFFYYYYYFGYKVVHLLQLLFFNWHLKGKSLLHWKLAFFLAGWLVCKPGRVAQSVGHLTRKSGVLGTIPGLATCFHFSFRFFKKGSCQLLAKVCARSTG